MNGIRFQKENGSIGVDYVVSDTVIGNGDNEKVH